MSLFLLKSAVIKLKLRILLLLIICIISSKTEKNHGPRSSPTCGFATIKKIFKIPNHWNPS